ncbi:hypothetical protein F6X40_09805 [Paraburkholderia sp. UCT31]|uniref:hypothetical protein n=1 Tax=Paraburkholderia sp. UCT31 TaxID=2615209 RepID=UPI00165542F6|nr:hypothetical protein [Paraburkholderia sp. UCT31]MBC8737102.1 hypothetical protein [Paraburkholderia sp. UCT31]
MEGMQTEENMQNSQGDTHDELAAMVSTLFEDTAGFGVGTITYALTSAVLGPAGKLQAVDWAARKLAGARLRENFRDKTVREALALARERSFAAAAH